MASNKKTKPWTAIEVGDGAAVSQVGGHLAELANPPCPRWRHVVALEIVAQQKRHRSRVVSPTKGFADFHPQGLRHSPSKQTPPSGQGFASSESHWGKHPVFSTRQASVGPHELHVVPGAVPVGQSRGHPPCVQELTIPSMHSQELQLNGSGTEDIPSA